MANVIYCGNCSVCEPGKRTKIYAYIAFVNPYSQGINCAKKLVEIRRQAISIMAR